MAEKAPKPTRPPAYDAKTREKRLYENVRQANGLPYLAFAYETADGEPTGAPRFVQWLRAMVYERMKALAIFVDDQLASVNGRLGTLTGRVNGHEERIAELEAARGHFLSGPG